MGNPVSEQSVDLGTIVRPGDRIVWGQGAGEPLTLTEALVAQRRRLGPLSVFVGATFSDTLMPENDAHVAVSSFGAIGETLRRLTRAGRLQIIPCHSGQVSRYIGDGTIGCDVAFVQLAPSASGSGYSYGVTNDFMPAATRRARVVVGELNDQTPSTFGNAVLDASGVDVLIATSRSLPQVASPPPSDVERAIAAQAGVFIGDGATLQLGIGAIPDAILRSLSGRRDLGLHSPMLGDSVVDLIETGVITNARKPIDVGRSVTGLLIGTDRLYGFADRNRSVRVESSDYVSDERTLAALPSLVTINSAIEVDLTGQVNAEVAGPNYIGAVGGQADFVRAGHRSPGGRSIIALPATAQGGAVSRIVPRLCGPVTTARSEVDVVVTEHGAAELRGQPLAERARRLTKIAGPCFRDELARQCFELFRHER